MRSNMWEMNAHKLSGQQISPLGFYLGSKLNSTAAAAGFRPLDICLLIKDFTSCLVELSFDTIDKRERAPKYKCQKQWLKEGKSSERDITVDVGLLLTAAPASPRCLQKKPEMKKERVCQCVGGDGIKFQTILPACENWQGCPRAEKPLLKPW